MGTGLADTFLAVQGEAWEARAEDPAVLDARIRELSREAAEAWPGVAIPLADFASHLAGCAPDRTEPLAALDGLHAVDIYLALGCARGDAAAIRHFERSVLPAARPAIARIDRRPELVDELTHEVRIRLLVDGEGGPARIRDYLGRGPLTSWVQVVATRLAYSAKRKKQPEASEEDDELSLLPFDGTDPELAALRSSFAGPFGRAFREALGGLSMRERNVMRLYLLEGVPSEVIGRMYGVHRATVARWIAGVHRGLLSDTRRRLMRELGVAGRDLDTLMKLVSSRVDVSIATMLEP